MKFTTTTTKALLAAPALALPLMLPGAAYADEIHQIELDALNNSGSSGSASVALAGNQLTVKIDASGLVPDTFHAQHIHGSTDGSKDFICPTMDADEDGDGIVSTVEGLPAYGDIHISLTTKGDTSKDSGLAVERMPSADGDGNLSYERTIEVSDDVAANIKNLHVVQHGIDTNGNGKYDNSAGPSDLNPDVPLEATAPANCGMIVGAAAGTPAAGGVETGAGSTQGPESLALLALGSVAVTGAAGAFVYRRRLDAES